LGIDYILLNKWKKAKGGVNIYPDNTTEIQFLQKKKNNNFLKLTGGMLIITTR